MKGSFIALFVIISSLASARTYYVSTTGIDGTYPTRGTFASPWKTWHYAFNHTTPGDTCYFRGGVYPAYSTSIGVQLRTDLVDGTYSKPTCFFAYPPDWAIGNYPVLDCQNMTAHGNYGIDIAKCSHIYIKGLTVKNVRQMDATGLAIGWHMWTLGSTTLNAANDIKFENCVAHNIGGHGFMTDGIDSVYFYNCDAYNICDSLTTYDPGGWGTGFGLYRGAYIYADHSYTYLYGCRGWNCTDQAYSSVTTGLVEYDHCIAFHNGYCSIPNNNGIVNTKGSGWKYWLSGTEDKNPHLTQLIIHNCIAVDNEVWGFNAGDDGRDKPEIRVHIYNNFAFRNGKVHPYEGYAWGLGIADFTNVDTVGRWDHKYSNNVSYNNTGWFGYGPNGDVTEGVYKGSNNLFDLVDSPVNDPYFLSLDTTGLCGARQSDGSLPETNFGKPSSKSPLIDAGAYVGLPYNGDAPDIGWAESTSGLVPPTAPVYSSAVIENETPARLEITYTLSLANIIPDASAFTVMVNSTPRSVSSVSVSGTKVLLTLASPIAYGNVVTVAYTKPATNPLQTPAGGQAVSLTPQTVTNRVTAPVPVYVNSTIEDLTPSRLEISYSLSLANIVPAASAFTVRVNSAARSVSSVAVSGNKVILTLTSPVVYDDMVTVAYTKPAINPIQTASGGQAASISVQSVSNNCRLPVNQPPVANLLSPGKSSSFIAPATITFEVNAYDPDGAIVKIEIFNGSIKLTEINTTPYYYSWKDVPAGTYSITVIATDNLNSRTVSEATTIVVNNYTTSVNQLPIVNITSPGSNSSVIVPAAITLTADATDLDGTISKVEFYIGNNKIGESTKAPYAVDFNCVKAGTYEIIAIATDNLNATSPSSSVMFFAEFYNGREAINIYPNPNNGQFTISLINTPLSEENTLKIAALNGDIVYTKTILKEENPKHYDLTYLEAGVYVLIITNKQIAYSKVFIKK